MIVYTESGIYVKKKEKGCTCDERKRCRSSILNVVFVKKKSLHQDGRSFGVVERGNPGR